MNREKTTQISDEQIEFINKRSIFLINWLGKEVGRLAKYLFISNAGGAVATLSFLGAIEKFRSLPPISLRISLIYFAIGIILVGCIRVRQYYRSENLHDGWNADVNSFFSGELTWEVINKRDEKRCKASRWGYILSGGSFACFIFGIIAGAAALFRM